MSHDVWFVPKADMGGLDGYRRLRKEIAQARDPLCWGSWRQLNDLQEVDPPKLS